MFSKFFINRPIFAAVVAIVMVFLGALSITQMAVEQYPEIAPPTVQVKAVYPGADAQTIAETVAAPIEQEVNGVEDMLYMSSIASADGTYTLTITFALGSDVDMASVRVQNRVAVAETTLPEEVRRQGITTTKQSSSMLMVIAPHSPDGRFDQLYLSNYASIYMVDTLSRVEGVGSVNVFGAKDYSMRVWLDPEQLAARDLTTQDVVDALRTQNVQVAAGRIGQEPAADPFGFQLSVTTQGRLRTPKEFEETVIKVGEDQATLYLRDIARVELGAQNYDSFARFNGFPAPVVAIYQLPGSNALAVAEGVKEALAGLAEDFPDGLEAPIFYNFTEFVEASITEVVNTLIISTLLVVLTVFVFLQDVRATIIPAIAIPVSIVASFAVLLAFGFGLNMLTLLGLVLAIGIVVDDAIVVVENTDRLIQEEGLDPKEAAKRSMREITGPVVATTLVLLAVFVPTAVLPGITGQLYRQFGVTLSVATVLSSVNALTLSPALCGILLRKKTKKPLAPFRAFNAVLDKSTVAYRWTLTRAVRVSVLALFAFAGMLAGAGWLFTSLPAGFLPSEDQQVLYLNLELPPASKVARTDEVLREVEAIIEDTAGVSGVVSIGGFSILSGAAQPNNATCIVILDDWDDRTTPDLQVDAILGGINMRLAQIPDAIAFAFGPPPVQGLGSAGGFDIRVQDRANVGLDVLETVTRDVVGAASQSPEIVNPFTSFSTTTPQLYLEIDRVKAQRLGVPLSTVFGTLSANLGSSYVNDFNAFGRTYQVRVQAEPEFRQDKEDILLLKVRNRDGATLPLDTVASIEERVAPTTVYRYNLYPAATVTGDPGPGVSTGQAMDAIERIAETSLPSGFGYEWTGTAFQQKAAGNVVPLVFALALVFVYLFLAAQYESWALPSVLFCLHPRIVSILHVVLFCKSMWMASKKGKSCLKP
ncbi:MAG: efflux RND transporter permease subunit, partial [Planctomycetota bacterium]